MEDSQKIVYHATQAFIHLRSLIDMKLPDISATNRLMLGDAVNLVDELSQRYSDRK